MASTKSPWTTDELRWKTPEDLCRLLTLSNSLSSAAPEKNIMILIAPRFQAILGVGQAVPHVLLLLCPLLCQLQTSLVNPPTASLGSFCLEADSASHSSLHPQEDTSSLLSSDSLPGLCFFWTPFPYSSSSPLVTQAVFLGFLRQSLNVYCPCSFSVIKPRIISAQM